MLADNRYMPAETRYMPAETRYMPAETRYMGACEGNWERQSRQAGYLNCHDIRNFIHPVLCET